LDRQPHDTPKAKPSQAPKKKKEKPPLYLWRDAMLASELESGTRLVLLVISTHMDSNGNNAWPSQERLARETGMVRRSIVTHIQKAQAGKWLKVSESGLKGQAWKTHQYEISYPKGCATSAQPSRKGGERSAPRSKKKVVQITTEGCANNDRKVVQPLHTSISESIHPPSIPEPGGLAGRLSSEKQTQNPNPAIEGKPATAPIGEEPLKKTKTRLGEFIVEAEAETGRRLPRPRRKELVALDLARREHGNQMWWDALWEFVQRREGFEGLHSPWSLFIDQLETIVAGLVRGAELEAEEERREEEEKRARAWRCPDCGHPAAEYQRGWACMTCRRPMDEAKVSEWRERLERERVERERDLAERERRKEAKR
jgi:hypothetical protein